MEEKIKREKVKYQISCGAIIFKLFRSKPYFLLVKYPTYWGFVKGLVNPGEDEELTAFREILEEVNMTEIKFIPKFREVANLFFKSKVDNEYVKKGQFIRKDAIFLLAEAKKWDVRLSNEHEDFKWCTYEDAIKLTKVAGVKKLLTKANIFIHKNYDLNLHLLKQKIVKV